MEQLKSYIDSIRETPEFESTIEAMTKMLNEQLTEYRCKRNTIDHKKWLLQELPQYSAFIETIYRVEDEFSRADYFVNENYDVYAKYNDHEIQFSNRFTGTSDHMDDSSNIYVSVDNKEYIIREEGTLLNEVDDGPEEIAELSSVLGVPEDELMKFIFMIVDEEYENDESTVPVSMIVGPPIVVG